MYIYNDSLSKINGGEKIKFFLLIYLSSKLFISYCLNERNKDAKNNKICIYTYKKKINT